MLPAALGFALAALRIGAVVTHVRRDDAKGAPPAAVSTLLALVVGVGRLLVDGGIAGEGGRLLRSVAMNGDEAHELRVHGVAGASPESMLQQTAVEDEPGAEHDCGCPADRDAHPRAEPGADEITVWRAPRRDPRLRAWSWGSLTSGKWYQAFYLLLLPFMIANLAGWMVAGPAGRGLRLRWATLLVRIVGVLVTVVFVVSVQIVLSDLVAWQWLYQRRIVSVGLAGLGTVLTALAFFGLVVLTRIRPKPEAMAPRPGPSRGPVARAWAWWLALGKQWDRPRDAVGIGTLGDRQWTLWNSGALNMALRRLHLAAGLAVTALLAALPTGGTAAPGLRTATLGLAVAALAAVLALFCWIGLRRGADAPPDRGSDSGDGGLRWAFLLIRWVVASLAVAAVALAALLPIWWSEPVVRGWASLPLLRGSAVWVAVVILAAVVLLTVVNGGGRRAANPAAVLLLAASIGAGFGSGLISRAAGLVAGVGGFAPQVDLFVDWLAVAITTSIALVALAATVRWLVAVVSPADTGAVVPALTRRASWLTAVVGAVGAVFTIVSVVQVRAGIPVSALPRWFALGVVLLLAVPIVLVASVVAVRRGPGVGAVVVLGIAAVTALVVWAVLTGHSLRIAGIDVPPGTFRDLCLAVAVVLPTAAILGRIVAGLRDRSVRRGVGVLWDVGTFWPRWFHPLAPPTYSDRAVPQLEAQLRAELAARGGVLLAPHSQGTVIANAALLLDDRVHDLAGVALLSYGSPWGRLYAEFFPTQVDGAVTAEIERRLDGRWINLWRPSDPIGGEIEGLPGDTRIAEPCRQGHSDYWEEPAYCRATRDLRGRLDGADSTFRALSAGGPVP
ncbi:hypothetical protein [Pseudonocardia xishanensis]|uniref:Uncharacterized protein n=1 Tax=Pseudonocardia xishanensis TaxID=630995 RepID=A0ABP8RMH0_9PSEU